MMYDEYVEKIKKLSKIKNQIYKFRFVILSIIVIALATVITLLSIKGNTSELSLPESITYGEAYDAKCSAVMSEITGYEYKLDGTNEWHEGLPDKPGVYIVRAVSARTFGSGYSEEKKIEIAKRDLNLTLRSNTITYGDYPKIQGDNLTSGDEISNVVFTFDDYTKEKTLVNLNLANLVIKNNKDEDVTNCYNITYNQAEIKFNKLALSLTPTGATKIYDGAPLELSNTYEVSKRTGYEDVITVSSYEITDLEGNIYETVTNPGKYNLNIKSYDITSTNGSTLNNYNVTKVTTPLVIEKRDILVNTASDEFIYDGDSHKNDEFALDESTTLGVNDTLVLKENNTSVTHFTTVENKLEVMVIDNDGNDISNYYNIRYNYGSLKILKRNINVTLESDEITYDSEYHTFSEYEIDSFVEGDEVISLSGVNSYKNSGIYDNMFSINIGNPDDYNITYIAGKIVINKKPITIKPINTTFIYGDIVEYGNSAYIPVDSSLCVNDYADSIEVSVEYSQNDEVISPKNIGEYKTTFNSYESANYDVTFIEFGTLRIEKLDIELLLMDMEDVIYDGNEHPYYDTDSNYVSDTTLPYDEKIKVAVKYNGNDDIPLNANEYDISYFDYDVIGGNKDNYNIICNNEIIFNIEKKDLHITPIKFDDKVYDGEEYIYEDIDNNFIGIEDLVGSDKVKIEVQYTLDGIYSDKVLNAGEYLISVSSYSFVEGLEDNYNVFTHGDLFYITRREITLKPNDIENKIYDGIEVIYNNPTPIITSGSFVDGEGIEISSVAFLGDNGDINAINASLYHVYIDIISWNSNTLESNYSVQFEENTFEIIPRDITLLLVNDISEKEYDGIVYNYGYKVSPETPIVSGEELIPNIIYLGQNFGFDVIYNVDTYDVTMGDVTPVNTRLSNYNITKSDSSVFTVTPKHIEITPISFLDKTYDGIEYVYDIYPNNFVEYTDLISGDEITIYVIFTLNDEITDKVKDSGIYTISVDYVEFTNSLESNYVIDKFNDISFEILKRDVVVTLDKSVQSKIYDGIKYEYTPIITNVVDGEVVEVTLSYLERTTLETEILYVGTYDVSISAITENEYIHNYNIDITDTDVFTVNKKPVVIKPVDINITYGDTLTYDKNTYKFVSGELANIDDNTAIEINISYFKNDIEVSPKNADTYEIRIISHVSRNYDVTYNTGTLIINKFNIDITLLAMDSVTYDGYDHKYPDNFSNYKSNQVLPYNEEMKIFVYYNGLDSLPHNVGDYYITFKDYLILGESNDNYNVNCLTESILYKILKRDISLSPYKISDKTYDGEPVSYYSDNRFTITSGNMVAGEEFKIDYVYIYFGNDERALSVVNAGDYIVKIDIDDVSPNNGNTLKDNYKINVDAKTSFKILKRYITLAPEAMSDKEYDGISVSYYSDNRFTITSGTMVSGEEFIISNVYIYYGNNERSLSVVDSNNYTVKFDLAEVVANTTPTLKANYNINLDTKATFKITPREVTFTLASAINTKEYDGLVYDGYTATPDRVVAGETIIADINYDMREAYDDKILRNAGTYDVFMTIPDDNNHYKNGAKKSNYNINFTDTDVFTITKKNLTISYNFSQNHKLYDSYDLPIAFTFDILAAPDAVEVLVLYTNTETNEASYDAPYNAGIYKLSVKGYTVIDTNDNNLVSRIENYNYADPADYIYTIEKRKLAYLIDGSTADINYDGLYHEADFSPILGPDGDGPCAAESDITISLSFKSRTYGYELLRNADTYDIKINIDYKEYLKSNYIESLETKSFTIKAIPLVIEFTNHTNSKIYDGLVISEDDLTFTKTGVVDSDVLQTKYLYNGLETRPSDAGIYNVTIGIVSLTGINNIVSTINNYVVDNDDVLVYTIEKFGVIISPYSVGYMYDGQYNSYEDIIYRQPYYADLYQVLPKIGDMPEGQGLIVDKISLKDGEDIVDTVKDAGIYGVYIDINDVKPVNQNTKLSNYDIEIDDTKTAEIQKRYIRFGLFSEINGETVHTKDYDGEVFEYTVRTTSNTLIVGEEIVPTVLYLGSNTGNTEIREIDEYKIWFDQSENGINYGNANPDNYVIDISATSTFRVTTKEVEILLRERSSTYSGLVYTYDEEDYAVNPAEKYSDLIHDSGFVVKVKYYDSGKNEISEIKNAGTYYIKIDEEATSAVIASIEDLKTNYEISLDQNYVKFYMFTLAIDISPKSYIEDGVEKYASKVYDGKAYTGYDSTQVNIYVHNDTHTLPKGEGFTIIPSFNGDTSISVKDACGIDVKGEYIPYELELEESNVYGTGTTNLANYYIDCGTYNFFIYKKDVEISLNGYRDGVAYYEDKIYDGETYYTYDVTRDTQTLNYGDNPEDYAGVSFTFDVTFDYPDETKIFKNAGIYTIHIVNSKENPINAVGDSRNNYNFITNDYAFTISPRPVTISLLKNTTEKMYDGYEYIYDGGYEVTSALNFVGGAYVVVDVIGKEVGSTYKTSIIYAGQYSVEIDSSKTIMVGDLISNYDITSNNFIFTVTKRPVTVKPASAILTYNGEYQSNTTYELVDDSLPLAPGDSLVATEYTIVRKVTSSTENVVKYKVIYSDGLNNHESYDLTFEKGYITVLPKELRLVSKSGELPYNGEYQTLGEFEITDGLCDNDEIVITNKTNLPKVKDAGFSTDNNLRDLFTIKSKIRNEETISNYRIVSYESGTLSVVKRVVHIIGFDDLVKEYSNKAPTLAKTAIIYEDNKNGNIISSDGVKLSLVNQPIEVGNYVSKVNITIDKNAYNYTLIIDDGAEVNIEIYKRNLDIVTSSYTWEYDGNTHECLQYDSVKRLVSGHKLEMVSGTSITDVGSVNNVINFIVRDKSGNDITYNYEINEEYGILEVVGGMDVGIKISDIEYTGKVANITKASCSLYSPTNNDIGIYELVSVSVNSVDAVEVGTGYVANINYSYRNNNTLEVRQKTNVDVTFDIVPISIGITIKSKTVDFTGLRHKIDETDYTINSGKLLAGDTLRIVGDNEGYNGNIKVGLQSYTVTDINNNDVSYNYIITAKAGKIAVNKISISVTTGTGKWSYDGDRHYDDDFEVTGLSQYSLKAVVDTTSRTTITNAGTVQNKTKILIQDILGRNQITDSDGYVFEYIKTFDIKYTYGNLTVEKANLYISSPTIEGYFGKTYQTQPNEFEIYIRKDSNDMNTINVNGTKVTLNVLATSYYEPTYRTGTDEDSYPENEYNVISILDMNGKNISSNFNSVEYKYGKVRIYRQNITIKTLGGTKVADGTNLYSSGVEITYGNTTYQMTKDGFNYTWVLDIEGNQYTISLVDDSSRLKVGIEIDKYTSLHITNSDGKDVTDCFSIISELGKLIVNGNE